MNSLGLLAGYLLFLFLFFDLPLTNVLALNLQSILIKNPEISQQKPQSPPVLLQGDFPSLPVPPSEKPKEQGVQLALAEKKSYLPNRSHPPFEIDPHLNLNNLNNFNKLPKKTVTPLSPPDPRGVFKMNPSVFQRIGEGWETFPDSGKYGVRLDKETRLIFTLSPKLNSSLQEILKGTDYSRAVLMVTDLKSNSLVGLVVSSKKDEFEDFSQPLGEIPLLMEAKHPAASLLKIVTATAGIEKFDLHPGDSLKYFNKFHGSGEVKIRPFWEGFAGSDNDLFGSLAEKIGESQFQTTFNRLLSPNLSLPYFPFERAVILPSSRNDLYHNGSGLNTGCHISVFHALLLVNLVANDGVHLPPLLLERVENSTGGHLSRFMGLPSASRLINKDTAHRLGEVMESVVHNPQGTAYEDFTHFRRHFEDKIRGKTGTLTDHNGVDYVSWFAGFSHPPPPNRGFSVMALLKFKKGKKTRAPEVASRVFSTLLSSDFEKSPQKPLPSGHESVDSEGLRNPLNKLKESQGLDDQNLKSLDIENETHSGG